MHKCEHIGCETEVEDNFHFCYVHRKDKYLDTCKIHGVTEFVLGVCQKCKKLKKPIYRINKRNGKYYFNMNKKPLEDNYFMKPFYDVLTHKNPNYEKQFMCNITKNAGIYGIFERDPSKKDGLGKCLYVGQSGNIKNRIEQHKKNFVTASNHIKGLKAHEQANSKNKIIVIPNYKVEAKYYMMAKDHYLKDLKFVTLYKIDKRKWSKFSIEEQKLCLTFLEQAMIDTWKPKFNTFAARPSSY